MLQPNHKGLVLNYTGNGKGKTTAALGLTLRALGWDWRAAFLQFVKSDMETGEGRFFAQYLPNVMFKQYGLGCTFMHEGDHAGAFRRGWAEARELLQNFTGRLLVLDELNIAIDQGFIDVNEVIAALKTCNENLNVVITGRYAKPELLAVCDLVSEIMPVKHYIEQGFLDVKGLDL